MEDKKNTTSLEGCNYMLLYKKENNNACNNN